MAIAYAQLVGGRARACIAALELAADARRAVMRPTRVSPSQIKAVIARHLDVLQANPPLNPTPQFL